MSTALPPPQTRPEPESPGALGAASGEPPSAWSGWSLRFIYGITFLFIGAYGSFFPLWLSSSGWQESEIGWLEGIKYGSLILFPLLWGRLADRWGDGVRVVRVVALGSTIALAPIVLSTSFWPVAAAVAVWSAFRVGQVPSIDAVTLHHVARSAESYGRYRVWGSGGFICGGFVMAGLVALGGRGTVPWALVAMLLSGWVMARLMPPERRQMLEAGPPTRAIARLLGSARLRALLVVTFLSRLMAQGLFAFLPLHLEKLGVSDSWVPAYWAVGVVSEIVLIRLAPTLFRGWPPNRVLALCFSLCTLQFGLTAIVSDAWVLMGVMLLHGFTFGIWYVTSVVHLAELVPAGDRGTAQALFQVAGFGLGGMLSSVAAGYLYEAGAGSLLFGVAAVGSVVPLVVSVTWLRERAS